MKTDDNNQYKSIEVGNQTIIMDETQAFRVLHAMREEFGWVGIMFTESDVRESIADRRDADDKEPYTEDEMNQAVATITDSWTWNKFMEDWMQQEGFEVLNQAIWDELEWPEEKARREKEEVN